MARLINSRLYLDYNSTSPLAKSIQDLFVSGDVFFANPSSIHSSGKNSKRIIEQTKDFLYDTFSIKEKDFSILFHSGATEGINTIIKSFFLDNPNAIYFYFETDHSVLRSLGTYLANKGISVIPLPVLEDGSFDLDKICNTIKTNTIGDKRALLNYTWVNNETGVVFPIDLAEKIKEKTNIVIHVDAVQGPFKVDNWTKLSKNIDAYTFSGHKFSSLKGIGFSFFKENLKLKPLLVGGNQQGGLRSGTQNVLGIYSLELALKDNIKIFNFEKSLKFKNMIEKNIENLLGDSVEIIAKNNKHRSCNTINLILKNTTSDISLMAFDLAGVDVSSGSACSSGSMLPSHVLKAMGKSDEEAKSAIRLSFPIFFAEKDRDFAWKKIENVLARFK